MASFSISLSASRSSLPATCRSRARRSSLGRIRLPICSARKGGGRIIRARLVAPERSEEHTSELQSHSDLVCRLLLEKKKKPKCQTESVRTPVTPDYIRDESNRGS